MIGGITTEVAKQKSMKVEGKFDSTAGADIEDLSEEEKESDLQVLQNSSQGSQGIQGG